MGFSLTLLKERKDCRHFRVSPRHRQRPLFHFTQQPRTLPTIRVGTKDQELSEIYRILKGEQQADLEVLVHTSKEDLFRRLVMSIFAIRRRRMV